MCKSEVEHQYEYRNHQRKGNEGDFDKPPAGMLYVTVMFVESCAPCGGIAESAEQRRQKNENQREYSNSRPEKMAQRKCKRHEYHEEPAHEQQHTTVQVVMLSLSESFGYIPHIVDEANPIFIRALFHAVTSK